MKKIKMKKENKGKEGFILTDLIIYIILFSTIFMFISNIYLKTYKNYLDDIKKLKHIDYSYIAFERLKREFYKDIESIEVKNDVVYIIKGKDANSKYIKLMMKDNKLYQTFGSNNFEDKSRYYFCYELKDFTPYIKDNILFLKLHFNDLVIERGFRIGE